MSEQAAALVKAIEVMSDSGEWTHLSLFERGRNLDRVREALESARAEGRRAGLEEAAKFVDTCVDPSSVQGIAENIRKLAQK